MLSISPLCLAQPPYLSLVKKDDITFSQEHADNPQKYVQDLTNCLIDKFGIEYHRQKISFSEPTLEAAFYEKKCANEEREAYIAIYSMFENQIADFKPELGHKYATDGIKQFKDTTFREITDGFDLN